MSFEGSRFSRAGMASRPVVIQRFFPFMLDHIEPVPLQLCAFLVVNRLRRQIVGAMTIGSPAWLEAVALGWENGRVLDLQNPHALDHIVAHFGELLASEKRAAANLQAVLG